MQIRLFTLLISFYFWCLQSLVVSIRRQSHTKKDSRSLIKKKNIIDNFLHKCNFFKFLLNFVEFCSSYFATIAYSAFSKLYYTRNNFLKNILSQKAICVWKLYFT